MKFYQKKPNLSNWVTAFIFVAALIVFYQIIINLPAIASILFELISILSPFIVGFIIAFVLYIPSKKIERLYLKIKKPKYISKHARGLSVITVYILGITIIALILVLVLPWLINNLIALYNDRSKYYNMVVEFINAKSGEDGKIFGFDTAPIIELIDPNRYLTNINVEQLNSIANGVFKFGATIIDTVLAIFSSIYMLVSRKALIRSVGRFFTLFTRKKNVLRFHNYLRKIVGIFYSYMYGALTDAFVVAIICSIAFIIIGVPYALLFGFIIGIANLIPYFGAIIAGVGVSIFTLITNGFIPAIIVAASILVVQQIDGNILQPRIVGQSVGIHPLYTLIAITLGGGLIGFWGILIGVPVAATIQMIVGDILTKHEEKMALKESEDQDINCDISKE